MQASLASRLSSPFGIALAGAGVRYSAPDYQIYFEWVFYAAIAWGAFQILHWVWTSRATIWSNLRMIEPLHVIVLGLAIAVGGVVWQQVRSKPPHSVGDAPQTPPQVVSEPEKPKQRRYTVYEREQKLPVINEFRDFLEGPMQKIVDDGPRYVSNWWNAIKDPKNNQTYNGDLNAFFENLNTSADRIEELRKKHHRHEEIYTVTNPSYWNSAVPKMNVFRVNYGVAFNSIKEDAPAESFHVLMNPARDSFEQGLNEFTAWRNRTLGDLRDLERDMSSQ